jgi:hypothetical protein
MSVNRPCPTSNTTTLSVHVALNPTCFKTLVHHQGNLSSNTEGEEGVAKSTMVISGTLIYEEVKLKREGRLV